MSSKNVHEQGFRLHSTCMGYNLKETWRHYGYRYFTKRMNHTYAKRYLEIKKLDWRLTEIKEGDLVLDVGCGNPLDAIRATWFGARFVALDLSRQDLSSGKKFMRLELARLSALTDFLMADATMLPFKDNSFDVTVSYSAIEHVDSVERHRMWVREMARVTRIGGKVVLTTENKLNLLCFFLNPFRLIDYKKVRRPLVLNVLTAFTLIWFSRKFKSLKKFIPLRNDFYEWFFNPSELRQLLIESGLTLRRFDSDTLYYWGYRPPLRVLGGFALKIDSLINKLENVECLRMFKERIGFNCVKT